ncbi:HD-GYP domain-containing protein [Thermomicrobium sp. 4228-Ro]|uniref:HD-GYP domain-containing protein n=1 Tax=Thermomicrobium sp. 4228-Ro TaxID=2993937 RepID=UPI0022495C03|nr:HD-GYP domain-containing protein [Thermomicrobium sp. 4228-Ro]MCX2727346.1 HD-GYP domain-containing protein [Thermomicrobium sp. 4228-Ro]
MGTGRSSENLTRLMPVLLVLAVINVASVVAFAIWHPTTRFDGRTLFTTAILVTLVIIAEQLAIDLPIPYTRVTVSVSSAVNFAAVLTVGPFWGVVAAVVGAVADDLLERREPIKVLVNANNFALQGIIAGSIYYTLADSGSPLSSLGNFGAMLLAALTSAIGQTLLLGVVLSVAMGTSAWYLWRSMARGLLVEFLALPALGSLFPILAKEHPLALVLMVIPLLGPYLAFRDYRQLHHETQSTFELLADLLDRRDPYTAAHSQRVAQLTALILDEFPELSAEEREAIISAARIHDLGKVATSDTILRKPGRLTEDEFAVIKRHPVDGSEILRHLSPYRHIVEIVRHHHERWDGRGYPDGLAGEAIPFGSRVIAVADTYDAMTTDRPYRRALTHDEALAELRRGAGTQFDPAVVAAFERALARASEAAQDKTVPQPTLS